MGGGLPSQSRLGTGVQGVGRESEVCVQEVSKHGRSSASWGLVVVVYLVISRRRETS